MIRGLYTSGYGMLTLNRKMDVLANNLANVDTNGFKKDSVIFEQFSDVLAKRIYDYQPVPSGSSSNIGNMALFNDIAEVHTDFTQGSLENTNLKTDLAINGDEKAFFSVAVQGSDGNYHEYYTRDGSFKMDAQGRLVTKDGYAVMGSKGAITLNGPDFTVNSKGEVYQNDTLVDTLKIRKVDNPDTLRKFGMNLLSATQESKDGTFSGEVVQGFVERSNVDSVREMVDMISLMRSYEANQKMIQYQDSTLDKAVNDIGRV